MTAELVLSVLQPSDAARGYVASLAVTDQMIVALGGTSSQSPIVMASPDARHFQLRPTPRNLGLRDILAVGDALWACGEYGQLAVSRDHGEHWQLLETGTQGCLFALTLGSDGAIWVVGEAGYAAGVLGEVPRRIDVGTGTQLSSVHAVRDEIVMLGGDGVVLRWRDGQATSVACGTTRALTGLAITGKGTWVVVGDGGFVARSPDGTWYSRVTAGGDADLEAIGVLSDGTIAIAGEHGQLLVSADDARTWRGVAHDLGPVHLWSIERFGGGVLIGGDGGLIARLAPSGDATWRERTQGFGGPADADLEVPARPDEAAADPGEPDAELERTPQARWADLAWRWIDDGVAHRALLARIEQPQAAQIAAIDELSEASDEERAIALPRVAAELSPELEAVLVGSLVRADALAGVLVRPRDANGGAGTDGDEGAAAAAAAAADDAPDPARIAAALAMTERGLRLAPANGDLQFTHAMLLLDAERAGAPAQGNTLLALLPTLAPGVQINIVVRMSKAAHPRFAEAVELVLAEVLPDRIVGRLHGRATSPAGGGAAIASFGDIAHEMFEELGEAILARAPHHVAKLVPRLPDDAKLLSELAQRALRAGQRDAALALYDRLLAVPIPDGGDDRTVYLRALNNACVQAHAAGAFDAAVRIADRAQPAAHDNPHLYHAAACAYVAVHDHARAFEQVKLAVAHGYEHLDKLETDTDLGALLEWPELKALFRDWHARREGN
jgi:tetratricopeptide (TPR) repeat protein